MTGHYERKHRNDVGAKGVAMNSKAEEGRGRRRKKREKTKRRKSGKKEEKE